MLYMKVKNKQFSYDWATSYIKLMIEDGGKICEKSLWKSEKKLLTQPSYTKYDRNIAHILNYNLRGTREYRQVTSIIK